MPRTNKKIRDAINWLLELDDKEKQNILEHIELNAIFRLNDNDLENVKIIRGYVINLILDGNDDQKIIDKLIKLGINGEIALSIIDNFNDEINTINEAVIISGIENERFSEILDFVINSINIYNEYNFIPYSNYIEMFKFKNNDESSAVLRFINTFVSVVASRGASLNTVKQIFIRQYDIPFEQCEIFIKKVSENIIELRQAYIMDEIKKISKKVNSNDEDYNKEKDN